MRRQNLQCDAVPTALESMQRRRPRPALCATIAVTAAVAATSSVAIAPASFLVPSDATPAAACRLFGAPDRPMVYSSSQQWLSSLPQKRGVQIVAKAMLVPAVATTLPWTTLLMVCTLPTCLGFWKSEYGVSYGYGLATALSGALLLRQVVGSLSTNVLSMPFLAQAQAFGLFLYGVRLTVFLLYRELRIPKFREDREKIEDRSKSRGGRLKRLPFIIACAFLYLGLAAPAALSAKAAAAVPTGNYMALAAQGGLVGLMYVGWAIAALGDAWKTVVKGARGKDALVTSGPYAVLRHPNYTGEQLLWTANFLAGVFALFGAKGLSPVPSAVWLLVAALGCFGINFVLMQATGGLEAKQAEDRGDNDEYQQWVSSTWKGFAIKRKPAKVTESLDLEGEEKDSGSLTIEEE